MTKHIAVPLDELMDDGENQAVRAFLMLYGTGQHTIEKIRQHMESMGFAGYWPDWIATASGHLTKAGAQSWLRNLFDAERALLNGPGVEPVAWMRKQIELCGGEVVSLAVDQDDLQGDETICDDFPLYLAAPSAPKHGVEPLGYISKNVAEYLATKGPVTAPILLEKEFSDDVALYLAAPSDPVARCHECGKQTGDGWALYCVECAEKIAPVQAVPDWQPIETAPKDGTEIIAADSRVAGGFMQVVAYDSLYSAPWRTNEDYGYSERAFTHWTPRPQPPKEIEE